MPGKIKSFSEKEEITNETMYMRSYASKWMLALMEGEIEYNDEFFDCVAYLVGNLSALRNKIVDELKMLKNKNTLKMPARDINELAKSHNSLISECISNILDDCPQSVGPIRNIIHQVLHTNVNSKLYLTAKESPLSQIKILFPMSKEALETVFFIFVTTNYDAMKAYFKKSLKIYDYDNYHIFSRIFGISVRKAKEIREKLFSLGITFQESSGPRLIDELDNSIKGLGTRNLKQLLCAPIRKTEIDIDEINIPEEDKKYILRLLSKRHSESTNILVYGNPGLGKSSFARAIAKYLNVKAFEVMCRPGDNSKSRRASLIACLNLANKFPGAFVVVDEAEALLATESFDYEYGTEKAWLASFLEQKRNRIIWIANSVAHLNPAIKRRFAYSVKFPDLSIGQQIEIWEKAAVRLHVSDKISEKTIKRLINSYSAPISCVSAALKQAKIVSLKGNFEAVVEQSLKAYTILLNNGANIKRCFLEIEDTIFDGVATSMPVSDFLERMRKIDGCLKSSGRIPPHIGTVLLSGVSGGGKSHLGKYVAQMLSRPVIIKRPSDILDAFVGESEKNIARTFREAEDREAVLILDEVDSFIGSRENATRPWEVSQVNEMLTAMEEYRGICICTTNHRKAIDPAMARRFALKVEFGYAKPAQLEILYNQFLASLTNSPLSNHETELLKKHRSLCIGDFQNVANQFALDDKNTVSNAMMLNALDREEKMKLERGAKMVGFA